MAYSRYASEGKGLTDSAQRTYAAKQTGAAKTAAESYTDTKGVQRWRGSFSTVAGGTHAAGERYAPKGGGQVQHTPSRPVSGWDPNTGKNMISDWLATEKAGKPHDFGGQSGIPATWYFSAPQNVRDAFHSASATGTPDDVVTRQYIDIFETHYIESQESSGQVDTPKSWWDSLGGWFGGLGDLGDVKGGIDDTRKLLTYGAIGIAAIMLLRK